MAAACKQFINRIFFKIYYSKKMKLYSKINKSKRKNEIVIEK